jgi:hypothetical protein
MKIVPQGVTRRDFFGRMGLGLGNVALAGLFNSSTAETAKFAKAVNHYKGLSDIPNFMPRAKRLIYLFMSGGPSQIDLFDFKPKLNQMNGQELPPSVRMGQRLTGMSSNQSSLPLAGSAFKFQQHGQCGAWISELLPHTAKIVDDLCFIKSLHTEAINHDPAITFFQTGSQQAGRPSIGAWLSYGLGSANDNLPTFVVLISKNATRDQPLYSRLWGNGFLASLHQGVQFRSGKDPVLYLNNPTGVTAKSRRITLDRLADLNVIQFNELSDPDINSRIAQYEMAYRMQTSVPEVMDISKESDATFTLYGPDARKPGTFAANCLLARRLAERNVRIIQLYHQGWDHHGGLPSGIRNECGKTDQSCAALVTDLKARGLLDDTIVIWGGEFGRTAYSQGKLTTKDYGRDHHPRCFTMWMAGGGFRPGFSFGETDEFSYNAVVDPVHVHDFQATILNQLGIDHEKLTFKQQGRRFRLTDVHGNVVKAVTT